MCGGKVNKNFKLSTLPKVLHICIDIDFFNLYRQQITQIGGAFRGTTQQLREALDQITWNSDTVQSLQQAVLSGSQVTFCITNDSVSEEF